MKTFAVGVGALVLSACLIPAAASAPADASPSTVEHASQSISLTIEGTHVEYDATGFPVSLTGNLYDGQGNLVGRYEEALQPLFHPDYGLVGATGLSVFRFINHHARANSGEIWSRNLSLIVGQDPATGAFYVVSTGEVANGTRRYHDITGGLQSSSMIILGTQFRLETVLTVEYSR